MKIALYNSKGGSVLTRKAISLVKQLQKEDDNVVLVYSSDNDLIGSLPPQTFKEYDEIESIVYDEYLKNETSYNTIVFDLSGTFRENKEKQDEILEKCDHIVLVSNRPPKSPFHLINLFLELDDNDREKVKSYKAKVINESTILGDSLELTSYERIEHNKEFNNSVTKNYSESDLLNKSDSFID